MFLLTGRSKVNILKNTFFIACIFLVVNTIAYVMLRNKNDTTQETKQKAVEIKSTDADVAPMKRLSSSPKPTIKKNTQENPTQKYMNVIQRLAARDDMYSEETWEILEPLFEEIRKDDESFKALLHEYKKYADLPEHTLTTILLGRVDDQAVRELSLDLLASKSRTKQSVALELVARQGNPNPQQVESVLTILESSPDLEQLNRTYYALPRNSKNTQVRRRIEVAAIKHVRHSDVTLRRRALEALGTYISSRKNHKVFVEHLSDDSMVVRAEAIKCIALHPDWSSQKVKSKLLEISKSPENSDYVKELAEETLFDLDHE